MIALGSQELVIAFELDGQFNEIYRVEGHLSNVLFIRYNLKYNAGVSID